MNIHEQRPYQDEDTRSERESEDDAILEKHVKSRPISPYLAEYLASNPSHADHHFPLPPASSKSLKDLRILVIEDSNFQRKLIVRGLMKCIGEEITDYEDKWPVVSIGNGEEAFKLLESQRYDIFIVDENLDGTGGILKGHQVILSFRLFPLIYLGHCSFKRTSSSARFDHYWLHK